MPNDKQITSNQNNVKALSPTTDYDGYFRALRGSVVKGAIRLIQLPQTPDSEPAEKNKLLWIISKFKRKKRG